MSRDVTYLRQFNNFVSLNDYGCRMCRHPWSDLFKNKLITDLKAISSLLVVNILPPTAALLNNHMPW